MQIVDFLKQAHAQYGNWRSVSQEIFNNKITAGMLSRIVKEPGYLPKSRSQLHLLGLGPARPISEKSPEELRWCLAHRR